MPFCYDGVNDMFEPSKWDIREFAKVKVCQMPILNQYIFLIELCMVVLSGGYII